MRLKYLLILLALLFTGCASKYEQKEVKSLHSKLDTNKKVVISTPKNGMYGNIIYPNSGKMTANIVKAAFARNVSDVKVVNGCSNLSCLSSSDKKNYDYYVKPTILQWEDRATEWSGKSDIVEIKLEVYDLKTLKRLSAISYSGKSKWATLGGDHPQDLLNEPTSKYVNGLYLAN